MHEPTLKCYDNEWYGIKMRKKGSPIDSGYSVGYVGRFHIMHQQFERILDMVKETKMTFIPDLYKLSDGYEPNPKEIYIPPKIEPYDS